MKPRNIGPGGMSGRITAIDVNLQNPDMTTLVLPRGFGNQPVAGSVGLFIQ